MKTTNPPQLITALINIVINFVEALLALRVILKLFGASSNAPFVNWAYETTQPLVTPFVGMFPSPRLPDGFVIEFSAIFAVVVYAFIGYLATEVIETLVYYAAKRKK